jgi:hypothetical protein
MVSLLPPRSDTSAPPPLPAAGDRTRSVDVLTSSTKAIGIPGARCKRQPSPIVVTAVLGFAGADGAIHARCVRSRDTGMKLRVVVRPNRGIELSSGLE